MISAPICRTCKKQEWRHICSGVPKVRAHDRKREAAAEEAKPARKPKRKPKR